MCRTLLRFLKYYYSLDEFLFWSVAYFYLLKVWCVSFKLFIGQIWLWLQIVVLSSKISFNLWCHTKKWNVWWKNKTYFWFGQIIKLSRYRLKIIWETDSANHISCKSICFNYPKLNSKFVAFIKCTFLDLTNIESQLMQ